MSKTVQFIGLFVLFTVYLVAEGYPWWKTNEDNFKKSMKDMIKLNKNKVMKLAKELDAIFEDYTRTESIVEFMYKHENELDPITYDLQKIKQKLYDAAKTEMDLEKIENLWNIPVLTLLDCGYSKMLNNEYSPPQSSGDQC